MERIYVRGCLDRETFGRTTKVAVYFTFHAEEAATLPSKELAQNQCPIFDSYGIEVPWAEGGPYVCKDFKVEERSPGQFVIFCDGPFTFKIAA